MKLVFMGTPALAVPALEMLRAEHEIALVVTQPDKPAGRSSRPVASLVKQYALQHGLEVAQPERARDQDFIARLQATAPDAIAVVAFGQILPRAVLDLPPRGCINLHYSLLPRWRGAAPVQHALLAGDTTTGVTTQHMAEKLDAGDIILQRALDIEPDETTGDLWQRLTPIGAEVLRDTMRLAQAGQAPRTPQPEDGITLAPSLKKSDGLIDWSVPAQDVVNRVRAANPWPGACCDFRGATLKIWRAAIATVEAAPSLGEAASDEAAPCPPGHIVPSPTGQVWVAAVGGVVRLLEVQAEGRPRLPAADWARGARLQPGQPLIG